MQILPNESMQQYRGRQKREMNAANDALNLKEGDPILYGSRPTCFHPRMVDRHRPVRMTRLEGEDLANFLAAEQEKEVERHKRDRAFAEREAFYNRNEVRDADAVRHIIEDRLKLVIDRLTPAEWRELREKLEA
jgi:hypothetical protein